MSSPDSTSVSTAGDIRGRWFGVPAGAPPRLGELRRGETIPWRVIAARSHRANAAARTDQMEPGLDRRDTSALLSAAIVRSGGSAASGPVLQKPMSGSAGPRSPELPSRGHSAAKPNRHLLRTAVDSTLSVHATHGERAHSRLTCIACDRKRSVWGFCGHGHLGVGMPESAPCPPDSCRVLRAGGRVTGARSARAAAPQAPLTRLSRERIMPGGGGREFPGGLRDTVQRVRGGWPFLCGVISRGGRGRGQEQPALPRSAGLGRCPGDMMIDWVSPACRGCGRSV
jgi:hypothetical protein